MPFVRRITLLAIPLTIGDIAAPRGTFDASVENPTALRIISARLATIAVRDQITCEVTNDRPATGAGSFDGRGADDGR